MKDLERLELLKAALAIASADGHMSKPELGVVLGLAARVGVGRASLEAMMDRIQRGDTSIADQIVMQSPESARTALELLVAQARIDGRITDPEREILVRIATRLNITGEEFKTIYQAGINRADKIRKPRGN